MIDQGHDIDMQVKMGSSETGTDLGCFALNLLVSNVVRRGSARSRLLERSCGCASFGSGFICGGEGIHAARIWW